MNPKADEILAIARSFWECRVLLTAAELDLFTLLAHAPLSAREATEKLHGNERALTILLDALAGMELLDKRADKYRCTPEIAALLAADAPRTMLPMVLHQAALWSSWSELAGMARGDAEALARAHQPRTDEHTRAFIGAMHVIGTPVAPAIVAALNPGPARAALDIGGATGAYTLALLKASPQLRATLFDLPDVVDLARQHLMEAGVLDRVTLVGGDFYTDELPGGHDLALLSAIIHQNSPDQNVALYRKVWRALVPGGRLVLRDHVMSPDRTTPRRGTIFALNMLVRTEGGNVYTFDECAAGLRDADFERIRLIQEDDGHMNGLIEAFKPAE